MDTLIRHGLIVTPQGRRVASIGIQGGRIAGIYEPGAEPEAREVIEADGLASCPAPSTCIRTTARVRCRASSTRTRSTPPRCSARPAA
ncbi:hypothetical protein ACFJGX_05035 [Hydrogenophaga sp. UC242_50]|uniref:hypothetical protein n=1 Tax=unclassified Hydrogenophaga TaxID=2610897 RepID=UPI0036D300CC